MRLQVIAFVVWLAVVTGGGTFGVSWWRDNQMNWACLTQGLWGDGGPGFGTALKRAAQPGEEGKSYRLFLLLRHDPRGNCAPVDGEKFWSFVEKASAEMDWQEAHTLLAFRHAYGIQNSEQAVQLTWPIPFQEEGVVTALHTGGIGVGENKLRLEESFDLIKKAAARGEIAAMWALSDAYFLGKWGNNGAMDIEKARDKSLFLLEQIAQRRGDVGAQYHAGLRWLRGVGAKVNPHKALHYFMMAAERPERYMRRYPQTAIYTAAAMSELAFMHAEGKAFPRDFNKAEEWMGKAEKVIAISDNADHREYIERQRLRLRNSRH